MCGAVTAASAFGCGGKTSFGRQCGAREKVRRGRIEGDEMSTKDANCLIRAGWIKGAEWSAAEAA
jgi:hypothetical protein